MIKIPAMVFSRCCGYFSPVYIGDKSFLWNKGKTAEYQDRKVYKIPEGLTVNFNKGKREEFAERKMIDISEFINEKVIDKI